MKSKQSAQSAKLGLLPLTGLVVGSIIGSGVFSLTSDITKGNISLAAVIIGWLITGLGMIMLALSFQNLARKKPKLDAGIYTYAEAGFGKYIGFNSAWGYWLSAFLGNVAYGTLMFSAISYFAPNVFVTERGSTVLGVIGMSAFLWFMHYMIVRGVKSATLINTIFTVAKLVPIAIFIIAMFIAFKLDVFNTDIFGKALAANNNPLIDQVRAMMVTTVWLFIGIEGAVLLSARAQNRKDITKATFLGLFGVLAVYVLVSVLFLGALTRPELAQLKDPVMANVLAAVVGPWGAMLINAGVIVSISGAWLAWTIFASELPFQAGRNKVFPSFFTRENANGVPIVSLTITNTLVQLFFISLLIKDLKAYTLMYNLSASAILVPYSFVALYQLKLAIKQKETDRDKGLNLVIGVLASAYAIWLVYALGWEKLLITSVLYAPGIVIYIMARLENKQKPFKMYELIIAIILAVCAIYAISQILISGSPINLIVFPKN